MAELYSITSAIFRLSSLYWLKKSRMIIPPILCHYGTRYSPSGSYRCQYCRCKIPQKLYQPRFVLLSHFSTDLIPNFILARIITVFFFFPQIITDLHRLFFCTEIRGFIINKDTAGSALIFPRHFVITTCFASSRLSLLR